MTPVISHPRGFRAWRSLSNGGICRVGVITAVAICSGDGDGVKLCVIGDGKVAIGSSGAFITAYENHTPLSLISPGSVLQVSKIAFPWLTTARASYGSKPLSPSWSTTLGPLITAFGSVQRLLTNTLCHIPCISGLPEMR
jgi:hypothetical protein